MIARLLVALGAVLVLGAVDYGAWHKEQIRRDGEVVYLELAPVDPRSLMQGDYMALRFRLAQDIDRRLGDASAIEATPAAAPPARRAGPRRPDEGELAFAPLTLDERRVATLADVADDGALRLRYRIHHGGVWLGTNAFFFSEGQAARLRGARYGEFRLDKSSGEAVLVGLRDAQLRPL